MGSYAVADFDHVNEFGINDRKPRQRILDMTVSEADSG